MANFKGSNNYNKIWHSSLSWFIDETRLRQHTNDWQMISTKWTCIHSDPKFLLVILTWPIMRDDSNELFGVLTKFQVRIVKFKSKMLRTENKVYWISIDHSRIEMQKCIALQLVHCLFIWIMFVTFHKFISIWFRIDWNDEISYCNNDGWKCWNQGWLLLRTSSTTTYKFLIGPLLNKFIISKSLSLIRSISSESSSESEKSTNIIVLEEFLAKHWSY